MFKRAKLIVLAVIIVTLIGFAPPSGDLVSDESQTSRDGSSLTTRRPVGPARRNATNRSGSASIVEGVSRRPRTQSAPSNKSSCAFWESQTRVVPLQVALVWKDEMLTGEASRIDAEWREKEPCFRRRIVTDAECRDLAARIPGFLPIYDAAPMNVMRADTCRVLAVYFYGGMYMDLDVKWARPLREWFNASSDITLGWEFEHYAMCNWYFAAAPMHPCMRRVIDLIVKRLNKTFTQEDFELNPRLVFWAAGPDAFRDGMKGCAIPSLLRADVTHRNIKHLYGSKNWGDKNGYNSWIHDKANRATWRSQFYNSERTYLAKSGVKLLGESRGAPLKVAMLNQSSWLFKSLPFIAAPHLAVDDNLETFASTANAPKAENWWEMTLRDPIELSRTTDPALRKDGVLNCIKIFNRRDGDFEHFLRFTVNITDSEGRIAANHTVKTSGGVSVIKLSTGDARRNATRIRLHRTREEISLSEIQLFTDKSCSTRRKIVFDAQKGEPAPPSSNTSVHQLLSRLMKISAQCVDDWFVGAKSDDSQWGYCRNTTVIDAPIVIVGNRPELEKDFVYVGLNVHTLNPSQRKRYDEKILPVGKLKHHAWPASDSLALLGIPKFLNVSRIALVVVTVDPSNFSAVVSQLNTLSELHAVEQVFIDVVASPNHWAWVTDREVRIAETLLAHFVIVASRFSLRSEPSNHKANLPHSVRITLVPHGSHLAH